MWFDIHVTFQNLHFCFIWSFCKRIFIFSLLSYVKKIVFDIHLLKQLCILHCFYDLATQFYIVLCCLIFILHDNFMLKDKNIFFLHVAIERWYNTRTHMKRILIWNGLLELLFKRMSKVVPAKPISMYHCHWNYF